MNTKKIFTYKSFWACLLSPISVGTLIAIIIGIDLELTLDFSYEGITLAFTLFKIPISIFALTIPSVGIWLTVYRSNQLNVQIKHLSESGSLTRYTEHKKEFLNLLDELEKSMDIKFFDKYGLYKKVFPDNDFSCISFNISPTIETLIRDYIGFIEDLRNSLHKPKITDATTNEKMIQFEDFLLQTGKIYQYLCFWPNKNKPFSISSRNTIWYIKPIENDLAENLIIQMNTIRRILEFGQISIGPDNITPYLKNQSSFDEFKFRINQVLDNYSN